MIRYFNEDDNEMNIDVQVGPQTDVSVSADPEEAVPGAEGDDENDVKGIVNPVAIAKADAKNVTIAAIPCDKEGCEAKCEFYVDLNDVATFANLNEMDMFEALNAIIEAYSDSDMSKENLFVVCAESDMEYATEIDEAGGNCLIVREADDITMDVQVGPNGEEIDQSADPQDANPVDAVKRQYNNVVVAKSGDEFFVDVEDVQKCADLNCESVIDTLNGIISCNEASGISAENIVVLYDESTSENIINTFDESGVIYEAKFELLPKFADDPDLKKYIGTIRQAERLLNSKGEITRTDIHKFGDVALRILDIIQNIGSAMFLPFCLFIVPIPTYLFSRLWSWAFRAGREAVVKDEGKKILIKLDEVIKKTDDDELKEKLIEQKEKIFNKLAKLEPKDDDEE